MNLQNTTKKIVLAGCILLGLGYIASVAGEFLGRDMSRVLNSILPILGGLAGLKFVNETPNIARELKSVE